MGYGSLFRDSNEEPPSPFCEWPSPPRGRAINPLRWFIRVVRLDTGVYSMIRTKNPPRQALRLALSPKGACDMFATGLHSGIWGRALFRIIKSRITFRISYLRRIKFVTKKINFVNISYLLFPIFFPTPSPPQSLAALSPFQGACESFSKFILGFEGRTPPRHSANGPLPQGGVRIKLYP